MTAIMIEVMTIHIFQDFLNFPEYIPGLMGRSADCGEVFSAEWRHWVSKITSFICKKRPPENNFGHETGPDARSRAETLGIRSCAPRGGFPIPPGLPRVDVFDFLIFVGPGEAGRGRKMTSRPRAPDPQSITPRSRVWTRFVAKTVFKEALLGGRALYF